MTRFMAPRLVPYLGSGEPMGRSGGRDSVIAVYQAFDTADEPITLGLGNDEIWRRFWVAVCDPDAASNPAHTSNLDRRADRRALVTRIADVLKTRGRDAWLRIFADARVPAGPIYRLDEIAQDQGLLDRGLLYAIERDGSRLPQVGLGIGVDGTTELCRRPPPHLGADNEAVFRDRLGLTADEFGKLVTNHII